MSSPVTIRTKGISITWYCKPLTKSCQICIPNISEFIYEAFRETPCFIEVLDNFFPILKHQIMFSEILKSADCRIAMCKWVESALVE